MEVGEESVTVVADTINSNKALTGGGGVAWPGNIKTVTTTYQTSRTAGFLVLLICSA